MSTVLGSSNCWSTKGLLTKAQRYAQIMGAHPKDTWEHAFWSTLVLELLARASLSNISPALLADPRDWNNIYSALGHTPRVAKFVPKSIDISSVFARLAVAISGFTPQHESFAVLHMSRRNEELHSSETPFDSIKNSAWLPHFYEVCEILLSSAGENLEFLLGKTEASIARQLIAAANDQSAKAIGKSVDEHKQRWAAKDMEDKTRLSGQASVWATKQDGHRVNCPACSSDALVVGVASTPPIKTISDNLITERQEFIPTKFECIACGLKISGLSQLSVCGLGDAYTATTTYDAAQYYAPEDQFAGYEPDFNEP